MGRVTGSWRPVGVDSDLERGPRAVPAVPHRAGQLELLPFHLLEWPDFESLQWRVLRDVEGLRHAQIYGNPGQVQLGLDIVAVAADGSGVALQSKRVKEFGPSRISAAVDAFRTTERPFEISRFILGVSREVRSTQALDRFRALREELKHEPKSVELELWDKRELSYKLKGAPEIVIEYFGNDIAKIFCAPFIVVPRIVPRREVVAVREAIARTPEVTTGARGKIAEAEAQAEQDAAAALGLVEEAQTALTEAGFAGHAAQHEALRARLLLKVGRGAEATRRRLDQLWLALDQGHTTLADIANTDIRKLAGQIQDKVAEDHGAVGDCAVRLYANPLASVPRRDDLMVGDSLDRARLTVLAGETALAAADQEWLKENAARMSGLASELPTTADSDALRVRLRILAAEGSDEWASILGDARSLKLGYEHCALVQARYARYLAGQQRFVEADASWDEAAGNACLAERWTDASRWIFSRRTFRARWRPFTSDELLPIQTALSARGPDPTVLARDDDALEYAYGRLAEGKLRPAAIAAQRALRDAVTLSDWEGERRARRLLAEVLEASGEQELAAGHLVLAGEVTALKRLGAERVGQFLDVTPHLDAVPWWVVGAAYQLLAAQADLVPDASVASIADHAVADIEAAAMGRLVDLPGFAGSRYLGAIAVLAGLAERLSDEQAERALSYFEAQPPVAPGHYRFHDEDEASVVAGILASHPGLCDRGLRHLVLHLGRSEVSRKTSALRAVTDRLEEARPLLERLAEEGNAWACKLLNTEHPEAVSAIELQEARARLEESLVHVPGVVSVGSGSGALSDSVLVRTLPVRDQRASLQQLLLRGGDPHVSGSDRASYLVAAANLRPPTDKAERTALLDRALALVLSPPQSHEDAAEASFRHPLGAMRISRRRGARGEAAYLASALARTREDKERVRAAAIGLVGDEDVSEVWVTRALQRLGKTLAPDVGFLSGQNWALRSLSAILWSTSTEPEPVGYRLALDADVRVRRTLAIHLVEGQAADDARASTSSRSRSLATKRREARGTVLALLRDDPCFSVRAAATSAGPPGVRS